MSILTPSKWLNDVETEVWKDLAKASPHLLEADRPGFEMLVQLTVKQRQREDMSISERNTLLNLLKDFQLTPRSRSKSDLPKTDTAKNPFLLKR